MRSMVCAENGLPEVLEARDLPSRPTGPGEVRVAIKAAGVNFPDLLLIAGTYQFKPPLPFTPGLEAAGVVVECGAGVSDVKPGDSVVIDGSSDLQGLYANEATVARDLVFPLPPGLNFAEGAAYPVCHGTSYHALMQAGRLSAGETLLVHGAAGGVGLASMQIGAALGARVIGSVGDDAKREALRTLGYKDIINYRTEDLRQRTLDLTDGQGANVICDPIGGDVFDASIRCIAREGRLLVIGFTSGRFPAVPANRLLIKEAAVIGVLYGAWKTRHRDAAQKNLDELAKLCARGLVKPHIWKTFPLSRAGEAVAALSSRQIVGKVVIETDAA